MRSTHRDPGSSRLEPFQPDQYRACPASPQRHQPRHSAGAFVARHPDRGLARSAADDRDPVLDSGPCRQGSRDSEYSPMVRQGWMCTHPNRTGLRTRIGSGRRPRPAHAASSRCLGADLPLAGSRPARAGSGSRCSARSMQGQPLLEGGAPEHPAAGQICGRGLPLATVLLAQLACQCTHAGKLTPQKSALGTCESSLPETRIQRVALREAVADPLAHGWLLLFAD